MVRPLTSHFLMARWRAPMLRSFRAQSACICHPQCGRMPKPTTTMPNHGRKDARRPPHSRPPTLGEMCASFTGIKQYFPIYRQAIDSDHKICFLEPCKHKKLFLHLSLNKISLKSTNYLPFIAFVNIARLNKLLFTFVYVFICYSYFFFGIHLIPLILNIKMPNIQTAIAKFI